MHTTLSAAVLLTVTQWGEQAASEMERDCQGNKSSRESQDQSEPRMKLEHTWDHELQHRPSLTAELTLVSIHGQGGLTRVLQGDMPEPDKSRCSTLHTLCGLGFLHAENPLQFWESCSPATPPKNSNDKEFRGSL